MKATLLTMSLVLGLLGKAQASPLSDHIHATLLDHVSTTALVGSGETDMALLDSVIQVGKHDNEYLLGLQLGFAGETAPQPGESTTASLIAGGTLRLNVLVRNLLNFTPQWEFLRSLEYGPSYHRNLREKNDMVRFSVGFAFDPQPKQ